MRKILILVPDLNLPGGVTNYFNTLKLEQNADIKYFTVNKLKTQTTAGVAFRLLSKYCIFFYTLLIKKYQVVHVNPSLDKRSFYRDAVFIFIARLCRQKTLVFFRGWLDSYELKIKQSRVKSFLFRISYAKATKFIVLSSRFKEKLINMGVSSATDFFIETTVAGAEYLSELNVEKKIISIQKKIIFLFLARIEKEKGVYIAIDAYRLFLKNNPEISSTLIIAGDGPELPAVKNYVDAKESSNITFTGYVKGDLKKELLLRSHVMVLPSYSEGLPNTILEGMLYGMPVISRNVGGIPDVVKHSINGFLSDSMEPEIFAGYFEIIAKNKELHTAMSKKNHVQAINNYTAEIVRQRIIKIYSSFNNTKKMVNE